MLSDQGDAAWNAIDTNEVLDLELGQSRMWNVGDTSDMRPAGRIRADHIRAQRDPLNVNVLNTYDLTSMSPYRQLMFNMQDPPQFTNATLPGRGQWGIK